VETLEEQDALFKSNGIRWSPLLDLPYRNPILFTAIERMHVFDVGLFQNQFGESVFLLWVVMGQCQWLLLFQDPQTLTLRSGMISYILLKIQRAFMNNLTEGVAHVIFSGISPMIMTCVVLVIRSN
jgi:hypothetical protein